MTTGPAPWEALTTPFASGSILTTDDAEIWFHDDAKDAEPLVMLGGFSPGHFHFDFVRPYLAGYRLLTWEPRGFGPSTGRSTGGGPYDVDTWVDDLRALLTSRRLEGAHVWANGFSTYVALQLAAAHPELVGSIVCYTDVWAQDPAKGYDRAWNVYRAIIESYGTTGYGAWLLSRFYAVEQPRWFAAWFERACAQVMRPESAVDALGHCLTEADVRACLPSITAPVLILLGNEGWDGERLSVAVDPSLELMQTTLPDASVVILPAHPIHLIVQNPAEAADAVTRFLEHRSQGERRP
jgi:pimeloyl-ACP methyl ester carboxylesterase